MAMVGMTGIAYVEPQITIPQQSEFSRIHDKVSDLADRAIDNGARLEALISRLFGEGAGSDANKTPKPVSAGAIGQIDARCNDLSDAVARQASAITRLEKLA